MRIIHNMRVIVIGFHDSDNLALVDVLVELEKRGHELTVFTPFTDETSTRMFSEIKANVHKCSELNSIDVSDYDCAFGCMNLLEYMKFKPIYCFICLFLTNT